MSTAEALSRIHTVHVYTNELLPDGRRRAIFTGPNRHLLMGGAVPRGKDPAAEWGTLIHPDDREAATAHAERNLLGQPSHVEYRLIGYDGVVRWIAANTEPRSIPGRTIYDGVSMDITAQKEAELERHRLLEELKAHNAQLVELDRLKDEFVALVSHELRTPLTSIVGYLELLMDGEAGEITDEQQHFLQVIDRNAQRLLRLVGDLLFVAQIEAGKLALEREPVDLDALVADSIEAARPRAEAKRIDLRTHRSSVEGFVGDRVRIAQLLDNLVSNAIKFTPEGGSVEVRLAAEDVCALLSVSDTGMGIPADELDKLFRRFYRTKAATTQSIPGTGLGLTIAKAIVEGHKGQISIESEAGAGTTFTVELPLPGRVREESLSGSS